MSRIGGFLTMVLGVVVIAFGFNGQVANGGAQLPTCGAAQAAGTQPINPCATGTITVTKTLAGNGTPPVGGWHVTITSDCVIPVGADVTLDIQPFGGFAISGALYTYAGSPGDTSNPCHYTLTETAVANYVPTFSPTGPYTLPAPVESEVTNLNVALLNTYIGPSPTITPSTTTPAPSPSTSVSTTVPATTSAAAATPTTTSAILAATGSKQVGPQVILGGALVLFGLVLTLANRRKSGSASHR